MCEYKQLNSYASYEMDDEMTIVKVKIDDDFYKNCRFCGAFFKATGQNHKYCSDCRSRIISIGRRKGV